MNNFTIIAANLAEYYVGFREKIPFFPKEYYLTNWDPVFTAAVLSDLSVYIHNGEMKRQKVIVNTLVGPAVGLFMDYGSSFEVNMADDCDNPYPKTELEFLTNVVMQVEFMIFSVDSPQFSQNDICNAILGYKEEIKKIISEVLNGKDPLKNTPFSMHDGICELMEQFVKRKFRTKLWVKSIIKEVNAVRKALGNNTWYYARTIKI